MQHSNKEPQKVSMRQAICWILLSVVLLSGSAGLFVGYYQYIKWRHRSDDAYRILAIVQTTTDKEGLKTGYLSELLDLSIDRPVNLYHFNSREARRKLLAHPLIKAASIRKVRPGTLYIDYELRHPIAFLADYTNTALDSEGVPVPFTPFFTPKKLPQIYLGMEKPSKEIVWGMSIKNKRMDVALRFLHVVAQMPCFSTSYIKSVDVSTIDAPSLGQREIVVTLEEQLNDEQEGVSVLKQVRRIIRLPAEQYEEALVNYAKLREHLLKKKQRDASPDVVIDLRLPHLGFFKTV